MSELPDNGVFVGISKHTSEQERRLSVKYEVKGGHISRRRESGFRGNPDRDKATHTYQTGVVSRRLNTDQFHNAHIRESLSDFARGIRSGKISYVKANGSTNETKPKNLALEQKPLSNRRKRQLKRLDNSVKKERYFGSSK